MNELRNNIKRLDRALDAMCQAASELSQADDWVGAAQLVTLEGMIDDLGERVTELRNIRKVMEDINAE